jgi:hypothetical protein
MDYDLTDKEKRGGGSPGLLPSTVKTATAVRSRWSAVFPQSPILAEVTMRGG